MFPKKPKISHVVSADLLYYPPLYGPENATALIYTGGLECLRCRLRFLDLQRRFFLLIWMAAHCSTR